MSGLHGPDTSIFFITQKVGEQNMAYPIFGVKEVTAVTSKKYDGIGEPFYITKLRIESNGHEITEIRLHSCYEIEIAVTDSKV